MAVATLYSERSHLTWPLPYAWANPWPSLSPEPHRIDSTEYCDAGFQRNLPNKLEMVSLCACQLHLPEEPPTICPPSPAHLTREEAR